MPQLDPFASHALTRDDPCRNAMTVTPSDADDLPVVPSYVWIESTDPTKEFVTLRMQMGAEAVTMRLPVINGLKFAPTRIYATGTDADAKITLFW